MCRSGGGGRRSTNRTAFRMCERERENDRVSLLSNESTCLDVCMFITMLRAFYRVASLPPSARP